MDNKLITVIIVTFNSEATINQCIKSFIEQVKNIEVTVVDNGSSDDTSKIIRQKFPHVELIQNEENLGFAKANNQVLRQSRGEFVLLLNPDTEVVGDALNKMVSYLEKSKNAGILGPKLLNADGSLQKELSSFPSLLSMILILLKLHRIKPFSYLVYPKYNYEKIQEVEHLMGSALLVRKEVFKKIGLFDENFFLWFEETDLEKRAKEAGFKVIYYPGAEVLHLVGHSTKQINPIKRQSIWNKSLVAYFSKHKSKMKLIVLIPFLLFSYVLVAMLFLKQKLVRK